MSLIEEFSVAGIVYYEEEYLLLKYGLGHWEFVKGHKESNESNEQTILRELQEETSIIDAAVIKGFKERYDYVFKQNKKKIHKYVICYLVQSNNKQVVLSYEHVDFAWLPFDKAMKRLTYDNAKRVLEKAYKFRNFSLRSFL